MSVATMTAVSQAESIARILGDESTNLEELLMTPGGLDMVARSVIAELDKVAVKRRALSKFERHRLPFGLKESDYPQLRRNVHGVNVEFVGSSVQTLCYAMRSVATEMILHSLPNQRVVLFSSRYENVLLERRKDVLVTPVDQGYVAVRDRVSSEYVQASLVKGSMLPSNFVFRFSTMEECCEFFPDALIVDSFSSLSVLSLLSLAQSFVPGTSGVIPNVFFFLPFSFEVLVSDFGEIPELGMHFRRYADRIGFYSATETFEFNFFEYKELITATVIAHKAIKVSGICEQRFELDGLMCCLMQFSWTRETPSAETKVFRPLADSSRVVIVGYEWEKGMVTKRKYVIGREMYNRAYTYAVSLPSDDFSLEQVLNGLAAYGDVTSIAARTLKVSKPLPVEAMVALARTVFLRSFEQRYDYTAMMRISADRLSLDLSDINPSLMKRALRVAVYVGIPVLAVQFPTIWIELAKATAAFAAQLAPVLAGFAAKIGIAVAKLPLAVFKTSVLLGVLPTIAKWMADTDSFRDFGVDEMPSVFEVTEVLREDDFPGLTGFGLSHHLLPRPKGYTVRVTTAIYQSIKASRQREKVKYRQNGKEEVANLVQVGGVAAIIVATRSNCEVEYREGEWRRERVVEAFNRDGQKVYLVEVRTGAAFFPVYDVLTDNRTVFTKYIKGFMFSSSRDQVAFLQSAFYERLSDDAYSVKVDVTRLYRMFKLSDEYEDHTAIDVADLSLFSTYLCNVGGSKTIWAAVAETNELTNRQLLPFYTCELISGEQVFPELRGAPCPNLGLPNQSLRSGVAAYISRNVGKDVHMSEDGLIISPVALSNLPGMQFELVDKNSFEMTNYSGGNEYEAQNEQVQTQSYRYRIHNCSIRSDITYAYFEEGFRVSLSGKEVGILPFSAEGIGPVGPRLRKAAELLGGGMSGVSDVRCNLHRDSRGVIANEIIAMFSAGM